MVLPCLKFNLNFKLHQVLCPTQNTQQNCHKSSGLQAIQKGKANAFSVKFYQVTEVETDPKHDPK